MSIEYRVTGASGGIGKATCRALARMGCSIAVHYHSNSESAGKLVEELRNMKVKAESFKADLTKYGEVGWCILSEGESR
jgi:3-oxoacyl-[acyl-carrier protein] reductase